MLRIKNMSGFRICQSSQYNEKRLVLEQPTSIFEIELFLIGILCKTKINHALF